MKVRELFEGPDKNFITMMNKILGDIPELKQKNDEFEKKIQNAVNDVPKLFQKQRDLEAWMSAAVQAVNLIPNKMLEPFVHELGDLPKEYQKNTSILDMLTWHLPHTFEHEDYKRMKNSSKKDLNYHSGNLERILNNPSDQDDKFTPLVAKFIKNHADDIEDCISAVDHGYEAIKELANKEKWPAPWERYGSLPSNKHAFRNAKEDLLYWVKELKK